MTCLGAPTSVGRSTIGDGWFVVVRRADKCVMIDPRMLAVDLPTEVGAPRQRPWAQGAGDVAGGVGGSSGP